MAMWLPKENGIPLSSPFPNCIKMVLGTGACDDSIKEAGQALDQKVCLHSECNKICFDRTFYALLQCLGYDYADDAFKHINEYKNDRYNPVMAFLSHFSRNGQDIEKLREPLVFADLCHLHALCQKYPTKENQNVGDLIEYRK